MTDIGLFFLLGQFQLQFLFDLTHHFNVIFEQSSILNADQLFHFTKILGEIIQNTRKQRSILGLTVHLVEHLVRVIDRSHGLVGACIGHSSPCVGTIRHHHTEFQRTESCLGIGPQLKIVFDVLVD